MDRLPKSPRIFTMPTRLTDDERDQIAQGYRDGLTIPQLAEQFDRGTTTVHRVLQKAGVETRSQTRYSDAQEKTIAKDYLDGLNAPELATKYECDHSTIYAVLRRQGVETRSHSESMRTYEIDDHAFDRLDTPEAAYWYGFFLGDGHLNQQGMTVTLQKSDAGHLQKLADYLKTDKPVLVYEDPSRAVFQIANASIRDALNRHGIPFGHKAYLTEYPDIDESLDRHLIRGLYDADGCITSTEGIWSMSVMGSDELMKALAKRVRGVITGEGTLRPYKLSPGTSYYNVGGNYQVHDLLLWLYQDRDLALGRKAALAKKAIADTFTAKRRKRLSSREIREITALLRSDAPPKGADLALRYGVSPSKISQIKQTL